MTILDLLQPVLARLPELDLSDPDAAQAILSDKFPLQGKFGSTLRAAAVAALADGSICGREGGPSKFSRLQKPNETNGFSVDAVLLWGAGIPHRHTEGEVNAMFAWEGEPEFCGVKPGWAVYAPGSQHVPTVSGGKMLIFYMLPNGAVEWLK